MKTYGSRCIWIHLWAELRHQKNASNMAQHFWPVSMDSGRVLQEPGGERGRAGRQNLQEFLRPTGARDSRKFCRPQPWIGETRWLARARGRAELAGISGADCCRGFLQVSQGPAAATAARQEPWHAEARAFIPQIRVTCRCAYALARV